jgi:hypothetical protein
MMGSGSWIGWIRGLPSALPITRKFGDPLDVMNVNLAINHCLKLGMYLADDGFLPSQRH